MNRMSPGVEHGKAIRSVSHLGLARFGVMPGLKKFSNRKERTGPVLSGSLRPDFLGQPFFYHAR
jgi:hypothetical protein